MNTPSDKQMKKIYLACPYFPLSPHERKEAITASRWAAERFHLDDNIVYCSIAQRALVSNGKLVDIWNSWEAWQPLSLSIIQSWADALYVVPINGWQENREIQDELVAAQKRGLEIGIVDLERPTRPLTVLPLQLRKIRPGQRIVGRVTHQER